jgi:hypothetical protein
MTKLIKYLILISILIFATGCTHKISITPNSNNFAKNTNSIKNYNVAYFLDKSKQNLSVVTPGGGGDKVEYKPYEDTEYSFRRVLSSIFNKVYKLNSLDDINFINKNNIQYVFTYSLKTNSSSESSITWPPTNFDILMECYARDEEGKLIWNETIHESAYAEFSEFKNDLGLSGKRASEKVFSKLYINLKNSNKFK